MMPAMYSAISGLEAHQTMLNVTANNLANVDTIGFKGSMTTFESELSQLINNGGSQTGSNGGTNPEQSGLGVQVGAIQQQMGAGAPAQTGNSLDVAIQGDGFFVVGSSSAGAPAAPNPYTTITTSSNAAATTVANNAGGASTLPTTDQYTQAGNFTTNAQGFLTTSSGQYVMGYTTPPTGTPPTPGAPNTYIYIPPGSSNVSIGQNGQVTYTDNTGDANNGQTVTAGYLALATFSNESGLTQDAGTEWSQSPNSGTPTYGIAGTGDFAETSTISGELEQSNVDMATEFTNMIEAERGYQANSSVIQTADTMMQTLIQMAQA